VDDFSWIIQFPHTHQSSEDLLLCDVFMNLDGLVPGAADDEVVYGEDRADPAGVTVEGVDKFTTVNIPYLDRLVY